VKAKEVMLGAAQDGTDSDCMVQIKEGSWYLESVELHNRRNHAMKTFTRWLLALLLVAAPAIAVVHTASANTELVPASRLVAPYITLETGRSTFLLLTNSSAAILNNKTGTVGGVHVEFYDKTCARNDIVVELSERDIDQVNVTTSNFTGVSLKGFADIDVRNTTIYTDSQGAASIRENALMGVVLVADSTNDFAFSYPMAASLGSAASGAAGGTIVTRNSSGTACGGGIGTCTTGWTGRYEPFPSRVYLPIFYAEGLDDQGATVTGFLSIVSPTDGNWHGGGTSTGTRAEAPGEQISVLAGTNPLVLGTLIFDGCEHNGSANIPGHTIMDTLTNIFTAGVVNRSNWTTANCTASVFPGRDELTSSGNQPLGWMQFTNTSTQCKGAASVAGLTAAGCGTATLAPERGAVGVFFSSSVGGSPSKKMADNSRLWGDPTTRTAVSGCTVAQAGGVAGGSTACVYNFNLTSQP
jgi:hypothetical protein